MKLFVEFNIEKIQLKKYKIDDARYNSFIIGIKNSQFHAKVIRKFVFFLIMYFLYHNTFLHNQIFFHFFKLIFNILSKCISFKTHGIFT